MRKNYPIYKLILQKYTEKELEYYKNMGINDKKYYTRYVQKNMDNYVTPEEWFKNLKPEVNKLANFVKNKLGENALIEYLALTPVDRSNYYTYLVNALKSKPKNQLKFPHEWVRCKIDNELNMGFKQIAERLGLTIEATKKIYYEAINHIKIIIDKNPKYHHWRDFL